MLYNISDLARSLLPYFGSSEYLNFHLILEILPSHAGFMAIAGEGTLGPCLTPSGGEGGSPRGGGGSFTEMGAGGGGGVTPGGRGYKNIY
jgi:hypothetical protein